MSEGIKPPFISDCELCGEPILGDRANVHPLVSHWQCALRSTVGGIGHLVAHDYWCGAPRHDPDAGLSYRQSALLVATWVRVVGSEPAQPGIPWLRETEPDRWTITDRD